MAVSGVCEGGVGIGQLRLDWRVVGIRCDCLGDTGYGRYLRDGRKLSMGNEWGWVRMMMGLSRGFE